MAERKGKGGAARKEEVVTREYTINLHKRLHGWYLTSPPALSPPPCCPWLPPRSDRSCAIAGFCLARM
jgi:hypothetical protein